MGWQAPGVPEALSLYDRGRFQESLDVLSRAGIREGDFFKTFERESRRWLDRPLESPADSPARRAVVAGTVALEIARALHDEPDDQAGRFLVWASGVVRTRLSGPPSEVERLWHLTCLAAMEALEEPWALAAGQESMSTLSRQVASLPRGGHLAIALARFPDEPRFLLGQALAATHARDMVRDIDAGFSPAALEAIRKAAGRYNGADGIASADIDTGLAARSARALARRAQIPADIRVLETLHVHDSLRADIALRIGYLEGARQNWPRAMQHLAQVPALTNDDDLRFLSYYFAGRILQATDLRADAIRALESALRIVPHARSASTLLAVELYLTDRAADRERAHALLRDAYANPAVPDPARLFDHGDARLWPTYLARLREALQ